MPTVNDEEKIFIGPKSSMSLWHRFMFNDENKIWYNSLQQYIEYQKALLFDDIETAQKILKTSQPRFQEDLGKHIKGYNKEVWLDNALNICTKGCRLKFTKNKSFIHFLLMNPDSKVYYAVKKANELGIGMDENDSNIKDESKYKDNIYGEALMVIRKEFLLKEKYNT